VGGRLVRPLTVNRSEYFVLTTMDILCSSGFVVLVLRIVIVYCWHSAWRVD
jgi:hypothetical protein